MADDEDFITDLGTGMERVADPSKWTPPEPVEHGPIDWDFTIQRRRHSASPAETPDA